MKWWNILKNAKISGKAKGKGSSFDASKIKINLDNKDDCCEKFWKTIQEFKNEHKIVFRVMVGLRYAGKDFVNKTFNGIGHLEYEGDTLVMPMSSNKPCLDSYRLYDIIEDIRNKFMIYGHPKSWDMKGYDIKGNMYPFEAHHYKKTTLDKIREWPELVSKFYNAFDELEAKYRDCPELMRLLRQRG